jgi:hypothetical protein
LSINTSKWLGACLLGGLIVTVFGAACLYAASHGGPAWMAGHEVSIFLKLSAVTAVAVVADICWRAVTPAAKADGFGDDEHEAASRNRDEALS